MCSGTNCPKQVIWRSVNLSLQSPLVSLSLIDSHKMIVPAHLFEPGLRQYSVTAWFDSHENIDTFLDRFDLNWDGVEYFENGKARATGGVVFKRLNKHYYMLLAPCLMCFTKLSIECKHNVDVLKRASLSCYVANVTLATDR